MEGEAHPGSRRVELAGGAPWSTVVLIASLFIRVLRL